MAGRLHPRDAKLCSFFQQGRCNNGAACRFVHGEYTLQDGPNDNRGGTGLERADANTDDGQSAWPPCKKTLCSFFLQGRCKNGAACRYSHGDDEPQVLHGDDNGEGVGLKRVDANTDDGQSAWPPWKKTLCSFFQQGRCKNGAACSYSHGDDEPQVFPGDDDGEGVGLEPPDGDRDGRQSAWRPWKKTLCSFFQQGRCKNGAACRYSHGDDDPQGAPDDEGGESDGGQIQCWGALCMWSDCRAVKHQRGDVRACKDGQSCHKEKHNCPYRHPYSWYGPCRHGGLCMHLECPFSHELRRTQCECSDPGCPRLHAEEGLGLLAARACKDADAARVRQARFDHMALWAKACDNISQEHLDEAEATVQAARAQELRAQLATFDAVCRPALERLLQAQSETRAVGAEEEEEKRLWWEVDELKRRLRREVCRLQAALPALAKRREVVDSLAAGRLAGSPCLVVRGATGSGKSTQLPQYLSEELCEPDAFGRRGRVVCTQPRKVAALALADRVAKEWSADSSNKEHAKVGGAVGVHVGGHEKNKPWTQIEYVTEEVLLQQLLRGGERAVDGIKAVILDEAHERTVRLDLLLGRLRQIQQNHRNDLCLVITSATLDVQLFANYLDGCAVVEIPGRMYPVVDVYEPMSDQARQNLVQSVIEKAAEILVENPADSGDILAFLPGQKEVELAKAQLEIKVRGMTEIGGMTAVSPLALHGGQDPDEQKPVFEKVDHGVRKVVFATNVAETSVTIDGVRFVIDPGVEKAVVYDTKRSMSSLREVAISRSSAEQRRGRAGRTSSGTCVRMYSEDDLSAMRETQVAEVLSQPAHLTILTLLKMDLHPTTFKWLEAPDAHSMSSAWATLGFLGALNEQQVEHGAAASLTGFGRLAAALQIDPCWAKILSVGCERGLGKQAADVVALMSVEGSFFRKTTDKDQRERQGDAMRQSTSGSGDVATMYRLFRKYLATERLDCQAFCKERWLSRKSLEVARKCSQDLVCQLKSFGTLAGEVEDGARADAALTDEELHSLILAGCFMNLGVSIGGRSSQINQTTYQLVQGSAPSSAAGVVSTGVVFPGSVMAQAAGNAPIFLCFVSMMQTSRLFLRGIHVLPHSNHSDLVSEVERVSPSFAEHLRRLLPEMNCSRVEVRGFTDLLLTGRRAAQNRTAIEDQFKCSAFHDVNGGSIVAYCQPKAQAELRAHLERLRDAYKAQVKLEVFEELLGGHTRAVYGRGGEVVTVLFPGECISVNVLGLQEATTEKSFRQMMERYGKLREATVVATAGTGAAPGQGAGLFSTAVFLEKAGAQAALSSFRGQSTDLVRVFPGGVRGGVSAQEVTGILQISWDVSDQVGSSPMDGALLSLCVAKLRRLVPLLEREPELESFSFERPASRSGMVKICGFKVTYPGGPQVLQEAYSAWQKPSQSWMLEEEVGITQRMLHSLSCTTVFQTVISAHKAIFDFFREPCPRAAACRWSDCQKDHAAPRCQRCNLGSACVRPKEGLRACKFLHPRLWYGESQAAADEAEVGPLQEALGFCRLRGTKVKVQSRQQKASVRIESGSLQQVVDARDKLLQALACDLFEHTDKDLLFQAPGIRRLQEIQVSSKVYIHWDRATRTVRVFGRAENRHLGLEALAAQVVELKKLSHRTFILTGACAKELKVDWKLREVTSACDITDFCLRGCILDVWSVGDAGLHGLEAKLRASGGLKEPRHRAAMAGAPVCCLCMCDFDADTWQLQGCEHRFCTACLKGSLSNPDGAHFPIRCPQPVAGGGMCGQPLVWRDIVGLCDAEVLRRIKSIAREAFVRDHGPNEEERPGEVMYCVKNGCNHFLRPPLAAGGSEEAEKRAGGAASFCELCNVTYCARCSKKTRKPVQWHLGLTCAEAQSQDDPDVSAHRDHIVDNFLTLRCPKCKTAFMDYDGCAAVQCGSCPCNFCAKCFKDCGRDAHAHAAECRGPGIPGIKQVGQGYSLSTPEFHRLNLAVAQYRVQEYLDSMQPELRKQVAQACRHHFKGRPGGDLNVKL